MDKIGFLNRTNITRESIKKNYKGLNLFLTKLHSVTKKGIKENVSDSKTNFS